MRRRGPEPVLAGSEVLTVERRSASSSASTLTGRCTPTSAATSRSFLPPLRTVHRTTLVRQTANLWLVKLAF
jgi:hypothetical protein